MSSPSEQREAERHEFVKGVKRRLEERLAATTAFSPEDRLKLMRICFTELAAKQGWLSERSSSLEGAVAHISLVKRIDAQVGEFARSEDEKASLMNDLILSFGEEIRTLQELPASERGS